MNIHFLDKNLLNQLKESTVATIKVGSHMYRLNDENSDVDYLSIYLENCSNTQSFMWEHHQLQYKENNTDFNFTTIQGFIRNTLTGDSTINFEVLFSSELKNSDLSWLYDHRESFINYNIIKSYLGIAKRDLKYYRKDTKNLTIHTKETDKKLSHFVRGIIFAKMLMTNNFVVDMNNTCTFKEMQSDLNLLKIIKSANGKIAYSDLISYFEKQMEDLRIELNTRLENKQINRFMTPENMKKLDTDLIEYLNHSNHSKTNQKNINLDYKNLFYSALENGINY